MRILDWMPIAALCLGCSSGADDSHASGGSAGSMASGGTGGHAGVGGSGATAGSGASSGSGGAAGGLASGGSSGTGASAGSGGSCSQCQNGDACCAPGCTSDTDDDCPVADGPVIFYTDITTGPNTGGEGNNGAYLTLFGQGFGPTQGSSEVTINGVPVANYTQWSTNKITIQPGASVSSGPIRVVVGSKSSNGDQSFSVVPGDIYFVSLSGDDSTGVAGDITHPFRTIQTVLDRSDFGPGDHAVVRGGTWNDVYAQYGSFFSIAHKAGDAGAPLVVMGYPTETINLVRTTHTNGIHSYDTAGHFVVANFHLDAQGHGISIGITPGASDVRVVNNEVKGMFEDSGGAAAIDGSGKDFRIFGNVVHDNGGSKLYHALYFDARDTTGVDDIEIAFNHIYNQTGGRGIQIYGDTGTLINHVRIHHNVVHDIHLDGILLGDYAGDGCEVYDNVVYRTANPAFAGPTGDSGQSGSCIRFNSANLIAKVYNNTSVDCALDSSVDSSGINFQNAVSVEFVNNIVATSGGSGYASVSVATSSISASSNLWNGSGAPPSWDIGAVAADPLFVAAAADNFRVSAGSPAIDHGSASVSNIVRDDFDGILRPQGGGFDIGAFEQ